MWYKLLLAVAVAAVLAPTSAQVTVEPQSTDIRVRECDDLVFVLTISGNYTEPYLVEVSCVSPGAGGGEAADFAGGNTVNSVNISMDVPSVELPLPLNDDTVSEQDEQFLCFFTSTAGVRDGVVMLTVIDNDLNCSVGQTSRCGMVPPPSCANPNPAQTDGIGCFCPMDMLIKADGTCVMPANCVDCPTDQAARYSKTPGPTCDNPNPAEDQTESFRCFCPDGMLIKTNGSCVLPNGCIDPSDVLRCNDTIIGDPLYEVPVIVDEEGNKISLCYEVQGQANLHFNLISDTCVSVNALYSPMINGSQGNVISKVGILAEDNNEVCQEIEADLTGCTARVNGQVTTMYNQDGINVIRRTNRVRVAVPNCENFNLVLWVICEVRGGQPMIKFVTVRGSNLRPTSHGLVGQFWNVKTEAERYNVTAEDNIVPDTNHYAVTVSTPDDDTRRFFAWKAPRTWDKKSMSCLYSGNAQGGPLREVTSLSDSVIQGTYNEYKVNGLFDPEYKYEMFNSQCL